MNLIRSYGKLLFYIARVKTKPNKAIVRKTKKAGNFGQRTVTDVEKIFGYVPKGF